MTRIDIELVKRGIFETRNKAQNEIWVQGIIKDILETNLSLKEISQKWNKSYATVKNINSGRSHKKEKYKYPLRDNK